LSSKNGLVIDMGVIKYGASLLVIGLLAFFLHQHGELHWAAGTGTVALKGIDGGADSILDCVGVASIDPVTDLVLLPSGGVLVASMSANSSRSGRISLLPSAAFSGAPPAPEFQPVVVSGFNAELLRPKCMTLLAHSEGSLLFVVQQWPAANSAFQRYRPYP
jgi:hypothetical protein